MARGSSTKKQPGKKGKKKSDPERVATPDATRPPTRAKKGCWEDAFLKVYEATGNMMRACRYVGVSRMTVWERRKKDKEFEERWADAEKALTDRFRQEAVRRATIGVQKGIYYQGRRIGTELQLSDRMLELLLTKRDPEFHESVGRSEEAAVAPTINWQITFKQPEPKK